MVAAPGPAQRRTAKWSSTSSFVRTSCPWSSRSTISQFGIWELAGNMKIKNIISLIRALINNHHNKNKFRIRVMITILDNTKIIDIIICFWPLHVCRFSAQAQS